MPIVFTLFSLILPCTVMLLKKYVTTSHVVPLAVQYVRFQRGVVERFYLRFKLLLAANRRNIGFDCTLEELPVVFCG